MTSSASAEQTAQAIVTSPARVRLEFLDGLRALAALFVVFNHAWLTVWTSSSERFEVGSVPYFTSWLRYGPFAVGLFIVLSGFCLMLPIIGDHNKADVDAFFFLKKRALRILPPYYCALACSLALIFIGIGVKTGNIWDSSLPVTGKGVVTHLLLIHNMFPQYNRQIDYPLWSIAVEWQIYFLFPLWIFAWRRAGALKTTLAIIFTGYAGSLLLRHTPLHGLTPQYLSLFGAGMLAAAMSYAPGHKWRFCRERLPWKVVALLSLSLLMFVCHRQGMQVFSHDASINALIGVAALALLVIVSGQKQSVPQRFLESKCLTSVGAFSYSLYLIHAPLLQLFWQRALLPMHLDKSVVFLLLIAPGVPLIIGASYLFYLICERPFMKLRAANAK